MTRSEEIEVKVARVRELLRARELAAVAFGTQANFAWITGGADNHVGLASEGGVATVVVTADGRHVVTSNIEADRVATEEIADCGFELHAHPWHADELPGLIARLAGGGPVGADQSLAGATNLAGDLARLRWQLLPPEVERYRKVGETVVGLLEVTAREVSPGMSELEIAGRLAGRCFDAGLLLSICLVAADDRAYRYRHPVPTARAVDRHAMLVVGARRWGLAISATRLVHFGPLPTELARKHEAVCAVDACFLTETRPGARVSEVFRAACQEYARQGFPDEWRLHHQGGATGYAAREYRATPDSAEVVLEGQAFAWNPSIAGTKSEDTILVLGTGAETLTPCRDWPTLAATYAGHRVERPAILVR